MDEIEQLWGLHIGILDEIDAKIEAAENLGAEMHVFETRAEDLRDAIALTFAKLRHAGNNDKAWEKAFLSTEQLYTALAELRLDVAVELDSLKEFVAAGDASNGPLSWPATERFLH